MRFPIGAMSVGDILDRALKVLMARLPAIYLINLAVLAPMILVQVLAPKIGEVVGSMNPGGGAMAIAVVGTSALVLILLLVLQPIGTAAILHVISEEFAGRHVSAGNALRFALTRFLPLLGTSLLAGLIIGVGFLLLIIPGIIFLIWYAFVGQVVVVEGLSGNDALSRSKALTAGYRWRIFGLLFIFGIIGWIAGAIGGSMELVMPSTKQVPAGPGGGFRGNAVPIFHYGASSSTR